MSEPTRPTEIQITDHEGNVYRTIQVPALTETDLEIQRVFGEPPRALGVEDLPVRGVPWTEGPPPPKEIYIDDGRAGTMTKIVIPEGV